MRKAHWRPTSAPFTRASVLGPDSNERRGSAERPSRKLRTLKGDGEVGGSEAEGEGKQGRDRDREERMGRLAMNGIGAQRLLGLGGLQGLPGMGGMAPGGLAPAQMVQPIQSMAS